MGNKTGNKSVRLSNAQKEAIIKNIVANSKLIKQSEKVDEELKAFAVKVRDFILGKHKENYLSLPGKFQRHDSDYLANTPGFNYVHLYFPERIPCPVGNFIYEDLSSSLQSQLIKKLQKQKDIKEKQDQFHSKVASVIYSCASTKQLLEAFPEAEKYFPESLTNAIKGTTLIPVVTADVLDIKKQLVAETV